MIPKILKSVPVKKNVFCLCESGNIFFTYRHKQIVHVVLGTERCHFYTEQRVCEPGSSCNAQCNRSERWYLNHGTFDLSYHASYPVLQEEDIDSIPKLVTNNNAGLKLFQSAALPKWNKLAPFDIQLSSNLCIFLEKHENLTDSKRLYHHGCLS